MTPLDVFIALGLTYFAVYIVDWLVSPVPQRRPIVVAVLLVLSFAFVYMANTTG